MSLDRLDLEKFLNNYLECDRFRDYGPNGLQVEGKSTISKIAFAVSATKNSIQEAIKLNADTLIVHHGLFWKHQGPKPLVGAFYRRVAPLIEHKMNLFAFHLPLDAHPEVGNAVGIAKRLKMKKLMPFGDHKGMPLGVQGLLDQPLNAAQLEKILETMLNHPIVVSIPHGNKLIKSLGIITGGANNEWVECLKNGLDAYLTGEISEYNWHDAQEAGITYFAGGHHATERFGVMDLRDKICQHFSESKIEVCFIDSENPA